MSNKLVPMQPLRLLIHYLLRQLSERNIAKELGLSRNTVKLYSRRIRDSLIPLAEVQKMSDADLSALVYPTIEKAPPDTRRIDFEKRIDKFQLELSRTGVTRRLLWEEYQKEYSGGYGYAQFCDILFRDKKVSSATMHFEYPAADSLLVDFAGDPLSYIDQSSGEVVNCPVLVCVLPFSGYSYVVALPNASLPQVVKGLNQCLTFFGGAPMNFKSDNMKQIVSRSCRYEPQFTEMIQAWALHNKMTLLAARVRKPKDKAPVESEVKLTYQRIYAPLRDRQFFSLSELNEAIQAPLLAHHERTFQKKEGNRLLRFTALEKPLLQTLPLHPYTIRHGAEYKVQRNYHFILGEDGHQYSVPYSYIGKKVQVIYDADTVEAYYEHKRIALHSRSYKKNGYTTLSEHMPSRHQKYLEQKGWDGNYFLLQAKEIGPSCSQYFTTLLSSKAYTEQTYNSCLGILRLSKAYGKERLEAACKRALRGRTHNYGVLRNILMKGLDKLQETEPDLFCLDVHENLRGSEAFQTPHSTT